MSFDPDAYLAKLEQTKPKGSPASFDPDAYLAKQAKAPAEAGSPLERALAEQSGDVVTVDTPTGPAKFTRNGERFYDADESAQMQHAADARLKERALEGGLSFLSGGGPLLDELAGAGRALSVDALGKNLGDEYRKGRDGARADVAASTRHASPQVEVAGVKVPVLPMLGAAVPSMLAPLPATAGARILGAGLQGLENAGAASEADLTRGEVAPFAADLAVGGGTGLATSALAEGVTAPLRAFARGATKEASAADKAALDALQAARDKALRSATSSMGGVAAGGANSIEKMEQVLANPNGYAPEVVAAARSMRALPEVQRAMDRAAMGNLDKLSRFLPDYEAAELARAEALAAARPAAVAADTAKKLELPAIGKDVGQKFMRSVGQRAALSAGGALAGSALSELTGGDWRTGGAIGAGSGWATPGVLQFLRNQATSPVVQSGANRLMSAMLRASSNGVASASPAISAAATSSPSRLSKAYAAMLEQYGLGDEAR